MTHAPSQTRRIMMWGAIASLCFIGTTLEVSAQDGKDSVRILNTATSAKARSEGFMTVQEGDTMYDLAGRHLGDVYRWPQLWSYNAHITNPHWIYPGDLVYLRDPSNVDGSQGTDGKAVQPMQYHIATGGFIETDEVKFVGRVVGSPKQAEMLSEHDLAWIGFGDKSWAKNEKKNKKLKIGNPEDKPKVGDVFAIIRPAGTVKDGDKSVGQKYQVLGSLRISEYSDKYLHTAEVTQSWLPIERGDLLVPYEEQIEVVEPKASKQNMVASIVDVLYPRSILGEFHYVFVNKGKDDGVEVGHRFFVYQQQEGLSRTSNRGSKEIPPMRVGQVVLTSVRAKYSTALIVDSSRELFAGDRLEMYEGY